VLAQSINRAFMNGSMLEQVVDFDLESPESVVIDWVARNLYWADSGTQRVEMSRIDGSSRRVIVWRNVQPRSLVVDPTHGFVRFHFCCLMAVFRVSLPIHCRFFMASYYETIACIYSSALVCASCYELQCLLRLTSWHGSVPV